VSAEVWKVGRMATVSAENVSEVFVEVAEALVGDFDLVEFLQMVTTHSSELASARAAGLLLAGPQKRLQLMAASDERAEMLELFQVQAREGPCQAAIQPVSQSSTSTSTPPQTSGPSSPHGPSPPATGQCIPFRFVCEIRSSGLSTSLGAT
jgi:hypothetical protein